MTLCPRRNCQLASVMPPPVLPPVPNTLVSWLNTVVGLTVAGNAVSLPENGITSLMFVLAAPTDKTSGLLALGLIAFAISWSSDAAVA